MQRPVILVARGVWDDVNGDGRLVRRTTLWSVEQARQRYGGEATAETMGFVATNRKGERCNAKCG